MQTSVTTASFHDQTSFEELTRGEKEMRKQKGFSLIELLIVVAIILIIAAIAIPNLVRARMAANDSSAAGSEHTIIAGEVGYYGAYPAQGYATLAQLGTNNAAPCIPAIAFGCQIDNFLATNGNGNGKSGYNFAATPGGALATGFNYYTTAAPIGGAASTTGTKVYCATDDGVLRYSVPAGAAPGGYAACAAYNPQP
jgi:prepilin-type N-terminal cleavage/methylation domain-containing protein